MIRTKCVAMRSTMLLAAAIAFAGARPSWAAHPLATEDTGTQGTGNLEFENGLIRQHASDGTLFMYQPQFSYGVDPALDLIIQPSWLSLRQPDEPTVRGLGDTNLDAKWRFFGAAPISLGVRAGLELPTSRHGLGLPHDDVAVHALLVTTFDAAPFTIHGNVGVSRIPGAVAGADRTWIGLASAALLYAVDEQLNFTGEFVAASDPDRSRGRWTKTALTGVIYTVHPGLDLDAGFQITRATVPSRAVLVGLTYRFAP